MEAWVRCGAGLALVALAFGSCARPADAMRTSRSHAPALVKGADQPPFSNARAVPGQFIVGLSQLQCREVVARALKPLGFQKFELVSSTYYLYYVNEEHGLAAVRKALAGNSCVRSVEPNFRRHAF